MRWLIATLLYVPLIGVTIFALVYAYYAIMRGEGLVHVFWAFVLFSIVSNAIIWMQKRLRQPRKAREPLPPAPPKPEPLPDVGELPQAPARPPERRFAVPPIAQGESPTVTANASTMSARLRRFVAQGDEVITTESENAR